MEHKIKLSVKPQDNVKQTFDKLICAYKDQVLTQT